MPDATLDFLRTFEDETAWDRVVKAVPIFVPHETKDRNGKPYKVDKARLERIARRINHLQEHYGVVIRLMPEHTKLTQGPDGTGRLAPQAEQPDTWGYACNARVGPWGPEQTPAILVDWYICPGRLADFKDRPYRSPEFFGPEDEIRAIAVLKTEPRLDMGMLAYGGDGASLMQAYARIGDWTFYSMESSMPDPTQKPDAAAGDDEFTKKCHAAMHQYMNTNFPHLPKMHEAYAAHLQAQAQPPAENVETGMPGKGGEPPAPALPAEPKTHPEQNSRGQIPDQYAKVFAAQSARMETLERQLRTANYEKALASVCQQYGLDLAAELADVKDCTQSQFDAHVARLKRHWEAYEARQLASDVMVDTSRSNPNANPNPGGSPTDTELTGTREQLQRAEHYMREYQGCDFNDAWDYARSKANTPREWRNGRNGTVKS